MVVRWYIRTRDVSSNLTVCANNNNKNKKQTMPILKTASRAAVFFGVMVIGTLCLWACVYVRTTAWDYVLSWVCTTFFMAFVTAIAVRVAMMECKW